MLLTLIGYGSTWKLAQIVPLVHHDSLHTAHIHYNYVYITKTRTSSIFVIPPISKRWKLNTVRYYVIPSISIQRDFIPYSITVIHEKEVKYTP